MAKLTLEYNEEGIDLSVDGIWFTSIESLEFGKEGMKGVAEILIAAMEMLDVEIEEIDSVSERY